MDASGRFDVDADTVTVEIDLDRFNDGEREASAREGLPPAAELRRGSRLRNVELFAYPRSAGAGPYDHDTGCNFIVDEET